MRLLEQEFEAEFIDRNAKDFALTDSGALFYEYAQKLLAFTDAQTREIRQRIQSAADTLHIGIPPTSGSIYYHTSSASFRRPTRILFCRSRRYRPGASSPFWMKGSWTWVWYWSPYPGKRM